MYTEQIVMEPIGTVVGGRTEPTDDYWGGTKALIRIDDTKFPAEALAGFDTFSHLEVVFFFHLTDLDGLELGTRRPRNNPDWPPVGNLAHRNMRKINRIGVSRCRLLKVDGFDLHIEDLDAVDGTPVLEIKPWFSEFGPRGEIRQPAWVTEMLGAYFDPAERS